MAKVKVDNYYVKGLINIPDGPHCSYCTFCKREYFMTTCAVFSEIIKTRKTKKGTYQYKCKECLTPQAESEGR